MLGLDGWCNPRPCNKLITGKNNRGYYWLRHKNKQFLVHRLIWLYVTGSHPVGEIDHINGDRLDNRWLNLRDVTPFENSRNQGNRSDNKTGCRGVTYCIPKRGNPHYKARISHKGVRHHLGNYKTLDEAISVRKQAEIDLKYHNNHGKREAWQK